METVARANWSEWADSESPRSTPCGLEYFQFFLRPSEPQFNYNLDQIKILLTIEFNSLYKSFLGLPRTPLGVHLNWAQLTEDVDFQRRKLVELLLKVFVTIDRTRIFHRGETYHQELLRWQYDRLIDRNALVKTTMARSRYSPDYEQHPIEPAWVLNNNMYYGLEEIANPLQNPHYSDCALVPLLLSFLPSLKKFDVDASLLPKILDWLFNGGVEPNLEASALSELRATFQTYTPIAQLRSQNRLELEVTKTVVGVVAPSFAPRGFRRVVHRSSGNPAKVWEEWCGDTLRVSLASKDISNWHPLAAAKRIRRFARSICTSSSGPCNPVLATYAEWSLNQLIIKVTRSFELGDYDNAVGEVMVSARRLGQFVLPPNLVSRHQQIHLILVAPIMPHTCEYLWQILAFPSVLLEQSWPLPTDLTRKSSVIGNLTHTVLIRAEWREEEKLQFRDKLISKKFEKLLPDVFDQPSVRHWLRTKWTPFTHRDFPDWVREEVIFLLLVFSKTPLPLRNSDILTRLIGPVVEFDFAALQLTMESVARSANQANKGKKAPQGPGSPAQLRIHNYFAKPKGRTTPAWIV